METTSRLKESEFFEIFRESIEREEIRRDISKKAFLIKMKLSGSGFVFFISGRGNKLKAIRDCDDESDAIELEIPDNFFDKLMSGAAQAMILLNRREMKGAGEERAIELFMSVAPYLGKAWRVAASG